MLLIAGALIGYFILENLLLRVGSWKEDSPFVRWATGWKIAAIAGTLLLLLYVSAYLRAYGFEPRPR